VLDLQRFRCHVLQVVVEPQTRAGQLCRRLRNGHKAHGHHRAEGGATMQSPRFDCQRSGRLRAVSQDLGELSITSPPAQRIAHQRIRITVRGFAGLGTNRGISPPHQSAQIGASWTGLNWCREGLAMQAAH